MNNFYESQIINAYKLTEDFNNHIYDYLKMLAKIELDTLNTFKKEIYYFNNYSNRYFIFTFYKFVSKTNWVNDFNDFSFILKINLKEFKINFDLLTSRGIYINFNKNTESIFVPYNKSSIDLEISKFKDSLNKDKKLAIDFTNKYLSNKKKEKIHKENDDKKLYGIYNDGKYAYQWKKCDTCYGSGKVSEGTGRYRQADYYDGPVAGDLNGEVQIFEDVNCSSCRGSGGFIEYSENKTPSYITTKKPCSLVHFKEYQDNFIDIILK